ncbi:site-specific integrase [Marinifilum sp. D714]|uniref:site-specific integrase n=1 Tax=Marinifilum sp. D714 TaxID=2937523 RepID=UPI0027BDE7F3|nr:site-specific integrase [Marinifilum sp. D714]MDQ2178598.1 site-specific integrase [Marinifilum sp. D714]
MRMFVSFILRKNRGKKEGIAPVYVRFTMNDRRVQLSTGISVDTSKWDPKQQKCIGRSREAQVLNNKILKVKTDLYDIYNQLSAFEEDFDVVDIKNRMLKVDEGRYIGVVSVFDYYLDSMKDKLHKSFSMETYKHYKSSKGRVEEFIKSEYKINDFPVGKINYNFLDKFDRYLKSKYKVHQNTAWNYHKHLRRILNLAISLEYMEKNPYSKYKVRLDPTNREFLTLNELARIENKKFALERLDLVKNIFVFACYTGLSYSDISKLHHRHLAIGDDGNEWLVIDRTKTNTRCRIPLLPKAKEILESFKDYPSISGTGRLLPVLSNQRLNSYLKEIADACKIDKNLSMHMARHTFATSVTLSNGVPIETVSKILGHTSLKTTQIYAKILDKKISDDMSDLQKKLEEKRKSKGV